jgi:transposase
MIADNGYDSDEFRQALAARNIKACIPPKRNRKIQHAFDKQLYKTRHKIENMFGKLKDWRRILTRYDRCAHISSPPSASQPASSSISINES